MRTLKLFAMLFGALGSAVGVFGPSLVLESAIAAVSCPDDEFCEFPERTDGCFWYLMGGNKIFDSAWTAWESDEYLGLPLYNSVKEIGCSTAPAGSVEVTYSAQTVDVGSWSGSSDAALGFTVPGTGIQTEIGGEVSKGGETTVEISNGVEARGCADGVPCTANSIRVGPGRVDVLRCGRFANGIWAQVLPAWPGGGCEEPLTATCAYWTYESAEITYISSHIMTEVVCGRDLTPEEVLTCGGACQ